MSNSTAARVFGLCALLLFAGSADALRSTKFQSFTDPDYLDYRPKKVLLLVDGGSYEVKDQIQERLVKEFSKRGLTLIPYREFFAPTRQWSAEDQLEMLAKHEMDSRLIVTVGASAASVMPIATQTYSTANVSGSVSSSGGFNARGSGQSTSHNIYSAKSKAEFSAVLMDNAKNKVVWYADLLVKAGGTLFVSEKGDAKGLVSGVIEALEEDGHIAKDKN